MLTVRTPGKVIWLGEQYVHRTGGVVSAIDKFVTVRASHSQSLKDYSVAEKYRAVVDLAAKRLQRRPLPYTIEVDCDVPEKMGLGSSTAVIVSTVALFRALAGEPFDRAAIFAESRSIERDFSGASGLDTVGCVYGKTHYYHPETGEVCELSHFPRACFLTNSGEEHSASCREPLSDSGIGEMRKVLAAAREPGADLVAAIEKNHALLAAEGLSTPAIDTLAARLRGKVTGRGRGGFVLSMERGDSRHDVVEGVRIVDGITAAVPQELRMLARPVLRCGDSASACASPNIALVKYWGKVDKQMPMNSSISLTLPDFVTQTTVKILKSGADCHMVDSRVQRFVDELVKDVLPDGCVVSVESTNNFPSACGIASSASGYAALARCFADLLGKDWTPAQREYFVAAWARLGSGSAIRSIFDGLVSWRGSKATQHAQHPIFDGLGHQLVVFDPFPKKVSSSDGHRAADTSFFHHLRTAMADGHTDDIIRAFETGDFDLVRAISEAEATTMHLVMETSDPQIRYLRAEAMGFVEAFVRFRNERSLGSFFTIDAGSNIHILTLPSAASAVNGFVGAYKCAFTLQRGVRHHHYDAVALSGKRYSGKTTLANRIAERQEVQMINISDAIKREYCAEHKLDADRMLSDRSLKEQHRERMISFAEQKIQEAGEMYWCWKAWNSLLPFPRRVVVTDLRRAADLAFFKTCTNCVSVRLQCDDAERTKRGWSFAEGVDDVPSETALDSCAFDATLPQNYDTSDIPQL